MNPEEIKPNHLYNVRLYFTRIDGDGDYVFSALPSEPDAYYLSQDDVEKCVFPLSDPADGIKSAKNAQKYDPCRKFREGDKVKRKKTLNGRDLSTVAPDLSFEKEYIITADEHLARIEINDDGVIHWMSFAMFELVTPVEELEPYSVHEADTINGFDIMRDGLCVMTFPFGSKEAGYYRNQLAAKAAAEAERDRLNAEYRKEQE